MDQDHVISSASCSRTTRVATESSDDVCPCSRELAVARRTGRRCDSSGGRERGNSGSRYGNPRQPGRSGFRRSRRTLSMSSITRTPTPACRIPCLRPNRSAFVSADHKPSMRSAMGSEALRPRVAQLVQIALATDDVEGPARLLPPARRGGFAALHRPRIRSSELQLDFCGVRLELLERPDRGEGAAVDGQSSGLVYLSFALGTADAVDELSGS
jgi:hypothetical protein